MIPEKTRSALRRNKVKEKRKYGFFKTDKRLISDACGSRYYYFILINALTN